MKGSEGSSPGTGGPCDSPLYGERSGHVALQAEEVDALRSVGLNIEIPLSGHFFTEEAYEATRPLLDRFHLSGNKIGCVNDDLARAITGDYPTCTVKASAIRWPRTVDDMRRTLELYDEVCRIMDWHDRPDDLQAIEEKDRVTVFANEACANKCPARICYKCISRQFMNVEGQKEFRCPPHDMRYRDLDISDSRYDGFTNVKLIPPKPDAYIGQAGDAQIIAAPPLRIAPGEPRGSQNPGPTRHRRPSPVSRSGQARPRAGARKRRAGCLLARPRRRDCPRRFRGAMTAII